MDPLTAATGEPTARPDAIEILAAAAGRSVAARDFLYDDPASFRAGVEEGIRAVLSVLQTMGKRGIAPMRQQA